MKKNNIAPERVFVFLASVFGLLMLIITPPFEVPDESEHLYRAYQISELVIIGQKQGDQSGGFIPKDIVKMTNDLMGEVHHPGKIHHLEKASIEKTFHHLFAKTQLDEVEFVDFRNTVLYPPIVYLPQSIGVIFAKLLGLSCLWMLYLGRLFNLIVFIVVVYYAVKIIPVYKWGIVLLALMPMSLAQVSSLSADSATFAVSYFLIAFVFSCAFSEEPITNSSIFKIAAISFLVGICKIAYILLPLIFIFIPKNKYSSKKNYVLSFSAVICSALLGFAIWTLLVRNLFVPTFDFVKPQEQIFFILAHPIHFILAIVHSIRYDILYSFVGIMGWLDTPIPRSLAAAYIGIIILCAYFEKSDNLSISLYQKFTAGVIVLFSFLLINVMVYLSWNRIGVDNIDGLQGRYFIPIAPLLLVPFYNKRFKNIEQNNISIAVTLFLMLSLMITVCTIVKRYYM